MSKCFVYTLLSSSRFLKSPILFLSGFQVPTNLRLAAVTHCLRCPGGLPSSCRGSAPSRAHPFFLLCYPGPFLPARTSPRAEGPSLVAPGGSAPDPRPRVTRCHGHGTCALRRGPSATVPSPTRGGETASPPQLRPRPARPPARRSPGRARPRRPTPPGASLGPAEPRGPRGRASERAAAPAHWPPPLAAIRAAAARARAGRGAGGGRGSGFASSPE